MTILSWAWSDFFTLVNSEYAIYDAQIIQKVFDDRITKQFVPGILNGLPVDPEN